MKTTSGRAPCLPGIAPSGQGQFPRLQLRGSAGFAPASLSSLYGEDALSKCDGKEQKQQREEFKWWRRLKSNRVRQVTQSRQRAEGTKHGNEAYRPNRLSTYSARERTMLTSNEVASGK